MPASEALDRLTTEARNPRSQRLDECPAAEIVALMNDEDALAVRAVREQAEPIARAVDAVADAFRDGGRLVYVGAGTSGRLGVLDASECPPTFGSDPALVVGVIAGGAEALTRAVEHAEDSPETGARDVAAHGLGSKDVLMGIATSGRTPYVLGALRHAQEVGATRIGFSCNAGSPVSVECDIAITPVVGPEILSGSTRLKAGTATKLVLNTITTGAMVRCGKTFGNLMVDLKPTNAKLVDRSGRILAMLADIPRDEADRAFAAAGDLKTAIVHKLTGLPLDQARRRLDDCGGHLRRALADA